MNCKLRRLSYGAVYYVPALVLLACSAGQDPIRIGLAGPFSDSVGAPMQRAAVLAVEQINASGGIAGRPVELVIRDDHGSTDSAVAIATELTASGVVAVVGHVYSGTTIAAAPVYNGGSNPVVQISPSSSAPAVTWAGEYTFRVCPSDLQQGAALARFAAERLGLTHGTILYLNDEYGRGIRTTFANEFSSLGGTIDAIDPYLGSRPAVGPYLERLRKRGTSQFVMIGGNQDEAAEAIRVAREMGIRVPFLGGDALEGVEDAGAVAEGTYISNGYLPGFDTPRNRAFVQEYTRRFPTSGPPRQASAATYDILFMLKGVIERVGTGRAAIRDGLAAIGTSLPAYDGVTGEIGFDENGDVPHPRVVIGQVLHGEVRAVEGL